MGDREYRNDSHGRVGEPREAWLAPKLEKLPLESAERNGSGPAPDDVEAS